MEEIAHVFWSDPETDHALCVGAELGDTADEDVFRAWCEAAVGDFPPVEKGSIEFASLACGTTNTGLRAICSECRSESKTLGNGTHFDVEVIRKHDPPYAAAVERGLTWTVAPAVVVKMYPELVGLWDVSRNTRGRLHRTESEVTGMTQLHTF